MVDIGILVKYLKDGKQKGFSAEQLKQTLVEQGYSLEEINKAIDISEGKAIAEIPKKHNILVFIVGGVLILILIGVLIFVNVRKYSIKTEDKFDESSFLKDPFSSQGKIIEDLPLPTKEDDPFAGSTILTKDINDPESLVEVIEDPFKK